MKPDYSVKINPSETRELNLAKYRPVLPPLNTPKPKHIFASADYIFVPTTKDFSLFAASTGVCLISHQRTIDDISFSDFLIVGGVTDDSANRLFLSLVPEDPLNRALLLAIDLDQQDSSSLSSTWVYLAPSSQLSPPILFEEKVFLIQGRDPELISINSNDGKELSITYSLKKFGNLYDHKRVSFAVEKDRLFLASLDGNIFKIDLKTGRDFKFYSAPRRYTLSPITLGGNKLVFGTRPTRNSTKSQSIIHVIDVESRKIKWKHKIAPEFSGRYQPIVGKPLVVSNTVYVNTRYRGLIALDLLTGIRRRYLSNKSRIDLGPVKSKDSIFIINTDGELQGVEINKPFLQVACHLDQDDTPVVNELSTVIISIINLGEISARPLEVVTEGDYVSVTHHSSEKFYSLKPGEIKSHIANLRPIKADPDSVLRVKLRYPVGDMWGRQEFDLLLPSLQSHQFEERKLLVYSDNQWKYNLSALVALIKLIYTYDDLQSLEARYDFHPQKDLNQINRLHHLITHIFQKGELEQLLQKLKRHNPIVFDHYKESIKIQLEESSASSISTESQTPFSSQKPISGKDLVERIQIARSVGRLIVPKFSDGQPDYEHSEQSTAWLVAPNLALTCSHSLAPRRNPRESRYASHMDRIEQIRNARVEFHIDGIDKKPQSYEIELLFDTGDHDDLDYALLGVNGTFEEYLFVSTSIPFVSSTMLYVIHYPQDGDLGFCEGYCKEAESHDLRHILYDLGNTMPGSSGGPVLDARAGFVALMHLGKNYDGIPKGLSLGAILKDLMIKKPEFYKDIEKAQRKGGRIEF